MSTICVFHDECTDGFAAAWTVHHWSRLTNKPVDFHAARYGSPPPDVAGKDVLIVDFSYKRDVLMGIAAVAKSILLLDHHRSALQDVGSVPKSVPVALSNGKTAFVDEADLPLVEPYSWSEQAHGGAIAYIGGGRSDPEFVYMHHLIMPQKDGLITDHANRNSLDNRQINLRYATKAQNGANMDRGNRFKGVTAHGDRWIAQIAVEGKNKYLGIHDTEEDAARAYDDAARAAWGEYARCNFGQVEPFPPNCHFIFDMERSGAGMTWDYLFPDEKRPRLIDHIQDRDLGGGIAYPPRLRGTREIHAALTSYPFDFDVWVNLMLCTDLEDLEYDGEVIDRKWRKDIGDFVRTMTHRALIAGHEVPACNLPKLMASDAGHLMAQGEPFAACYYRTQDGWWEFSLRSAQEGGRDVSEIAREYGGGGHQHAAGFRVSSTALSIILAGGPPI